MLLDPKPNLSRPRLKSRILSRAATSDLYALYRAGLEWGLIDPIAIDSAADLKSAPFWQDRIEPYHHQVSNLMTFCRRLPVTLLADDVGLGKTISAGLIASELISRRRLQHILIVAPKLLGPQWKEELESKFDIPCEVVSGRDLVSTEPPGDVGAVITTYHSARLHIEKIPPDRFQMLILDEAHKLRNLYGTNAPPKVALRFRDVLASRMFKYVLMLTATPIQNRLWDLYSLIDLLAVARGHPNPFGSEGIFTRTYIADGATKARQLKEMARDQFRSVVYGYMSRVRRADANLHFPERIVARQAMLPTPAELDLIRIVGTAIRPLNRLSQISILQALTSSPEALAAQLETMARNRTIPMQFAIDVRNLVSTMPMSAKLQGLAGLVDELRRERPDTWRMVVFTQRRETQTTIQAYLESQGIKVGIINGQSAARNPSTLAAFKKDLPDINVIVSTEAGSEGVNLQVANVLVNYDLPWNPMIVEQRIGRVQRLASQYANVFIYNVILKGTFEEYIVARLLEKLQMASHAIGDIEALLEASGIADNDEAGSEGFEEEIRRLVLASLEGKDVEAAVRKHEQSVAKAKATLIEEEATINDLLGRMEGVKGPRSPHLPQAPRSMSATTFALNALQALGAEVHPQGGERYACFWEGRRTQIRLSDEPSEKERGVVLYAPGTTAFDQLVGRITQSAWHRVEDVDTDTGIRVQELQQDWCRGFAGALRGSETQRVDRYFAGTALVHVRATVAHDSYERLVELPIEGRIEIRGTAGLQPLPEVLEDPQALGIDADQVVIGATLDSAVSEFCRFYMERRAEEVAAAGDDERKRKKLEDDFTPRLEMTLAGLNGEVHRELTTQTTFAVDGTETYSALLRLSPRDGRILEAPIRETCTVSGREVPSTCLGRCEVTGKLAIRHLLAVSEETGRLGLPAEIVVCALSGKSVLSDEVEKSAATGLMVRKTLLKSSAVSHRRAEAECFTRCAFTNAEILEDEVLISQVSGKAFRMDQASRSALSGTIGHRSEFLSCALTNQALLPEEADRCEVTGRPVVPGLLETCDVSGRRVLPSELETCAVTGRRALKQFLVASSLSGSRILQTAAVRSAAGAFCMPSEAQTCLWSGQLVHPDDVRTCDLTGVPLHRRFATELTPHHLRPLADMLRGTHKPTDRQDQWGTIVGLLAKTLGGRCRVEAARLSPSGDVLAVCAEQRTLLGFRVRHVGCLFSIAQQDFVGSVRKGRRTDGNWTAEA